MKTTLIALAAFVAGSLLVLPLAGQTGIFDSLFVDGVTGLGQARSLSRTSTIPTLPATASRNPRSTSTTRRPIYFLQWDQTASKPTWQLRSGLIFTIGANSQGVSNQDAPRRQEARWGPDSRST